MPRRAAAPATPDLFAPAADGPLAREVARFRDEAAGGWGDLGFFRDGRAEAVAAKVDARIAAGAPVLPEPGSVFNAFRLTPRSAVRAVILGQDPYPTPGDAHGLAFSYVGSGRLPASLRNIFKEYAADLGVAPPRSGSLEPWARAGVLLLNTALTVEAGQAGAHRRYGWSALADEAVAAVSAGPRPAAFILWGADAQGRRPLIDEARHLVAASAHPSPLAMGRGFEGSRPFSRVNAWLVEHGEAPIDWRLG